MMTHSLFDVVLVVATLLCTLNAGFLFAFAVVVMPGLKALDDSEFIRAFQKIDGVIQNGQPLFMLVWVGSAITLLVATVLGFSQLGQFEFGLTMIACVAYFIGVQLSTIRVNIPLNNQLQALDCHAEDGATLAKARANFETRWNQWNRCRTSVAIGVSLLLIVVG